jgi:hypothetical protein
MMQATGTCRSHLGQRWDCPRRHRLCSVETKIACAAHTRTGIETPHVLETPFLIATAEYPSHIVGKRDCVCAEAMSGECAPYRSLAPIHDGWRRGFDVHHIWEMRDRAKTGRWVGDRYAGRFCDGSGERG